MARTHRISAGVLTIVLTTATLAHAGPKVRVGQPCPEDSRVSMAQVDHSTFDHLLHKYVDEQGMVAYGAWKSNTQDHRALDNYLARLSCVNLDQPAPKAAQLAYWINAYNAVTIKGILREYPTDSIRNHTKKLGYNVWDDLMLIAGDRELSLNQIEHKVLRPMGDPRVHFALVCASMSCPPLRNEAYTAERLDAQLTDNAQTFLASPANFRADPNRQTVYMTKIFDWYGEDFAPSPQGQIKAIARYLPNNQAQAWMVQPDTQVRYIEYDWSLNDQARSQ